MNTTKICAHCEKNFILKNVIKWGKSRPGNYRIKEDDFRAESYYHSKCWKLVERAKARKNKLIVGVNSSGPSVSYEREF